MCVCVLVLVSTLYFFDAVMLWCCLCDTCGETDPNEMYTLSACVSQKVTTHFYSISFTHPFYLLRIWCKRESNVVVAMKRKREERVPNCTAQYSHPTKTQGKLCLFKAYTQIPSSSSACAEADLSRKRRENKAVEWFMQKPQDSF